MLATQPRLTPDQYDGLVYTWNALRPAERKAHAAQCQTDGHDWIEVPRYEHHYPTFVCRRCLRYDLKD
jgi:hypothetical protein